MILELLYNWNSFSVPKYRDSRFRFISQYCVVQRIEKLKFYTAITGTKTKNVRANKVTSYLTLCRPEVLQMLKLWLSS